METNDNIALDETLPLLENETPKSPEELTAENKTLTQQRKDRVQELVNIGISRKEIFDTIVKEGFDVKIVTIDKDIRQAKLLGKKLPLQEQIIVIQKQASRLEYIINRWFNSSIPGEVKLALQAYELLNRLLGLNKEQSNTNTIVSNNIIQMPSPDAKPTIAYEYVDLDNKPQDKELDKQ
ncbi:MAG TPA: hypothetical protein VNZ45_00370 [Bacteroidia bacterium]|jgi:hypothetical protein|nr:hypothetical protein [Bacteroidia bacterium]